MTQQQEALIAVDEVCRLLRVKPVTVKSWKRSGKLLPSETKGSRGNNLYSRDEVLDLARRRGVSISDESAAEQPPFPDPRESSEGCGGCAQKARDLKACKAQSRHWEGEFRRVVAENKHLKSVNGAQLVKLDQIYDLFRSSGGARES